MGELPLHIWQIKSQITLKKMKDWCSFITKIVVIYVPKFNQLLIRVFFFLLNIRVSIFVFNLCNNTLMLMILVFLGMGLGAFN